MRAPPRSAPRCVPNGRCPASRRSPGTNRRRSRPRFAVLDTGVDATHPDLARQVTETANFTDDADAVDRHGHGTHVAATIAGTGAASNGRHRGVAPDSRLLVGKVLNAYGFGEESWLIAAMEWAAPRADVVNMSLGTLEPSD